MTMEKSANVPDYPQNIILYGPPGTGKTYSTRKIALHITGAIPEDSDIPERELFAQKREDGQIEFVTFHQNYCYEDFMIGLRPENEAGTLLFKKTRGIFYRICDRARKNYEQYKKYEQAVDQEIPSWTTEEVLDQIAEKVVTEGEVPVEMASKKKLKIIEITESGTIRFKKPNGNEKHTLNVDTLKGIIEGKREITGGLKVYYIPLVNKINTIINEGPKTKLVPLKNYVLIIDEINRANISRVFGELITLLEQDKRLGGKNELRITLPDGEMDFALPPNLYIIGTMNTADKSIALLDVALRRRFEFKSCYPDYSILEKSRSERLKKINKEIYERKGSPDYLIGHSYFMNMNRNIDSILRYKIIPLLLEYFSNSIPTVEELLKKAGINMQYNTDIYKWVIPEDE